MFRLRCLAACLSALSLLTCSSAFAQQRPPQGPPPRGEAPPRPGPQRYSLEQALSENAQLHTIAFSGLAFLTGDFGFDTFLPPGKVSDYFGFQYMRDIDVGSSGHSTRFLTSIAHNMLAILTPAQREQLIQLARQQEKGIREFAEDRFPLIYAFRQNLNGELPKGSRGLQREAVKRYSAELYALDGKLTWQRAVVMAQVLRSLDERQKAALARLKFGDSRAWPEVAEPAEKRRLPHELDVAVMTYASEMFSWYAGSLEADTYFCPERHGMYFGGFGMKTAPAMGKANYSISTALTGDSGEAFLALLNEAQRSQLTSLIPRQRPLLQQIVEVRREIARELRKLLNGDTSASQNKVLSLSRRYGELDGELAYDYANAFAKIGQTLSASQRQQLRQLRHDNPNDPKGPFLYSEPIRMPSIGPTDYFFGR